ncbi:MAG: hypothetical protein Q7S21_03105 [archaeon]|nr:hypothetical protein [archaeon]
MAARPPQPRKSIGRRIVNAIIRKPRRLIAGAAIIGLAFAGNYALEKRMVSEVNKVQVKPTHKLLPWFTEADSLNVRLINAKIKRDSSISRGTLNEIPTLDLYHIMATYFGPTMSASKATARGIHRETQVQLRELQTEASLNYDNPPILGQVGPKIESLVVRKMAMEAVLDVIEEMQKNDEAKLLASKIQAKGADKVKKAMGKRAKLYQF